MEGVCLVSDFLRRRLENIEDEEKLDIFTQYKLFLRCQNPNEGTPTLFHHSPTTFSISTLKTTYVAKWAVLLTWNAFVFSSGLMVLVATEWSNHRKSRKGFSYRFDWENLCNLKELSYRSLRSLHTHHTDLPLFRCPARDHSLPADTIAKA